ncbi:MAG: class I tRNA ligase family protein, partial [Clostridia bacterium]
YIELIKPRLMDKEDIKSHEECENVLCYILSNTLKLLHPFMPFITEEIWQTLPHDGDSIMVSEWPKSSKSLNFAEDCARMELLMDAIRGVRNTRAEMNVPPSKKAKLIVVSDSSDTRASFEAGTAFLIKLAYASDITIETKTPSDVSGMVSVVTNAASIYIPMSELIDAEKELTRLQNERVKALKEVDLINGKLNNASFVARAPEAIVSAEREKLRKATALLAKIDDSITRVEV